MGQISQRQFQNTLWERRGEEGNKSLSSGLHHGDEVGQSPSGPQGVFASQSPRQKFKAKRPAILSCLEDQKPENAGMLGEKARGTGSPNLAKHQNSDTSGDEEEGDQKKRPTQNQGQRKDNTSRGGAYRKERRTWMEVGGRQIDKKERYLHDSDRAQNYGKTTRDALISVDSKFEGGEGDSSGGEKTRNSFPFPIGSHEWFNFDMGREIKACRGPKAREERSPASKSEDVGDEISQVERKEHPVAERLGKVAGTWPMLVTKARRIFPTQQEKEVIGTGQLSLTDCRSGAGEGSDLEVDRAQGRELDLGRPNRTGPGPKPGINSPFNELGFCGNTFSKAAEKRVGLRQEMQLRCPL